MMKSSDCPCVQAEKPVPPCANCFHFAKRGGQCVHCGQGVSPDLVAVAQTAAKEAINDALTENAALLVYQELIRNTLAHGEFLPDDRLARFAAVAWKAGRAFARARGER